MARRRPADLRALAFAALAAAAPGCESGTGGREVRFDFALASAPAAGRPLGAFTTSTGWDVTLEQACVALGPVYLYENAPLLAPTARAGRRPPRDWLGWLVPPAYAHAGDEHFDGGQVRGEWVEQIAFDALDPAGRAFPGVRGLAGSARSFSLLLDPPRPSLGDAAACLRGHHAYAAGVATRDGLRVEFEGGLDFAVEGAARRVDGVALDAVLDDGVRVVVELHVPAWFDQAHFERLTETAPSGRYLINPSSQVGAAWLLGARGASTFSGATKGQD
ncbi:MAG: hypothetical protein MUF34_24535 [Polyangiaceae bacterium]|nr:hypothetical protein [Polyangiaceae bacterium]